MIRLDLQTPLVLLNTALDHLGVWVGAVAFLLTLIGYYGQVWRQRHDPPRMLEAVGLISLTVGVAFAAPFWWPLLVNLMYFPAEQMAAQGTYFQINGAMNRFLSDMGTLIADTGTGNNGHGQLSPVWNFTWNFSRITRAGVADLLIHGTISFSAFLAALIVLPFYFLQHFLVPVFGKMAPVAVCAFTVPGLRSRTTSYFALALSVLAWPTGFTLVAFVVNSILTTNFIPQTGASQPVNQAATALAPSIQTFVAALVMILGTLLVPPTFYYLFRPASGPDHPPAR